MTHDVRRLSDQDLLAALSRSVTRSNEATVELLIHLGEADARELHLGQACRSMHAYCVERLHLSDGATYKRIRAARAARKFPVILEMLAKGELHLSAITLVEPLLTRENHLEVLGRARHQSKRAVEVLVAELNPRPDQATVVRRLPAAAATLLMALPTRSPAVAPPAPPARSGTAAPTDLLQWRPSPAAPPVELPRPTPADRIQPTAPGRYRVAFMANDELYALLERAQALLGHQIPRGDLPAVVTRALRCLVEDLERTKVGATKRPRGEAEAKEVPAAKHSASRHIPNDVRRRVWARDAGRCTFTDGSGHRCSATSKLEFDHLDPFSEHPVHDAERITLRCRAHNQYAAALHFGADYMARFRRHGGDRGPGSGTASEARTTYRWGSSVPGDKRANTA